LEQDPPAPALPARVVARTQAKYLEAYELLTRPEAGMNQLVEDFLNTSVTSAPGGAHTENLLRAGLNMFVAWAAKQGPQTGNRLNSPLMAFLQPRARASACQPAQRVLRAASAARAFTWRLPLCAPSITSRRTKSSCRPMSPRTCHARRWETPTPKALTSLEIDKLLAPETLRPPRTCANRPFLELAYASGLRLAELAHARLEHLHLTPVYQCHRQRYKERVVPIGRKAVAALERYLSVGRPRLVTPRSPANVFLTKRGHPLRSVTLWLRIKQRVGRAGIPRDVTPHMLRAQLRYPLLDHGADAR